MIKDLSNDFIQQLAFVNHEIAHYLDEQIKHPHISSKNYFYLLRLYEEPGIIQSDFSNLVIFNQSTITRAINGLVEHGYIIKEPTSDKRSQQLSLSQTGEKTAELIAQIVEKLNQNLLLANKDVDALQFIKNIHQQLLLLADKKIL